ncbi:MAG: hypothetical protein CME67_08040 [Halobacteriovoraceae bacterium]|nr:hypothetical protein [Halobacteriovoraceae bacterium]
MNEIKISSLFSAISYIPTNCKVGPYSERIALQLLNQKIISIYHQKSSVLNRKKMDKVVSKTKT